MPPMAKRIKDSQGPELQRGDRILGIDPGLRITGYSVLEVGSVGPDLLEAGVLKGGKGGLELRLAALYTGLVELLDQYAPQVMVVEQLFAHYKHPRTAIIMGHARGVLFLSAGLKKVPTKSYAASRIKKTICGHGRASKEQMQATVQQELRLATRPEPADVADAIAVALCHYYCNSSRMKDSV